MPKDPKLYFDYIYAKANSKKFMIEKSELNALISKWFTAEKNHIKTSIDTIISFVEALEFNVIKVFLLINIYRLKVHYRRIYNIIKLVVRHLN